MNNIVQALDQAAPSFRRLRFSSELERQFYEDHADAIITQRLLLLIIGGLMVACSPLFDSLLTQPPEAYLLEARRIQFGVILPSILLTFAFTADSRLRRWSGGLGLLTLLVVVGSWSYLRYLGLQLGYEVPVIMIGVLLAGALALAGVFFWALAPVSVLGLVAFSTVEIWARGPSHETLYDLLGLFLLALVTALSRYVQEYHQRASWLRRRSSDAGRRERAEDYGGLQYRDGLTGLLSRGSLTEALPAALQQAGGAGARVGLLFLDIDNFKSINESLGQSAGDRYLVLAAERLQGVAPGGATLFRYGGDEFALLLQDGGTRSPAEIQHIAERLRQELAQPYTSPDGTVYMTASVGIALYPGDGETAEELLANAEAAMYLAKRSGRNRVQLANRQLTRDAHRHLQLGVRIRRGIAAAEFEPYYQPIIDVRSGDLVGAEALLRWHDPQHGTVLANDFISVAEDAGLIAELGEYCLRQAYQQALDWSRRGPMLPVAVNLSAHQLQDPRLLRLIEELQAAQPLSPDALQFEITETAMMDRGEQSEQVLEELRRLGYRISIDDFGTGFSALSYLQRYPVHRIKIDRSFVTGLESSRPAHAIVAATIALGQSLGLEVVAEGVETAAQSQRLQDLGCHLQQGFLFAHALPARSFEAWAAVRSGVRARRA